LVDDTEIIGIFDHKFINFVNKILNSDLNYVCNLSFEGLESGKVLVVTFDENLCLKKQVSPIVKNYASLGLKCIYVVLA
jgi:hypothetical protein